MDAWSVLLFTCPNKLALQRCVCVGGRGMAASGWEMWDVGLGEGSLLEGKELRIQTRAKTGKRGFVRQVAALREHDCTASETGDSQTVLKL